MIATLDSDVDEFTRSEDVLLNDDRRARIRSSKNETAYFSLHLVPSVENGVRTRHGINMDVTADFEFTFALYPSCIE